MNRLEVGVKIARLYMGRISGIHEIERVSPKMAFYGASKFKREFNGNNLIVVGDTAWSHVSWSIASSDMIDDFNKKVAKSKLLKEITAYPLEKLSSHDLSRIVEIINESK